MAFVRVFLFFESNQISADSHSINTVGFPCPSIELKALLNCLPYHPNASICPLPDPANFLGYP
jgi:hypothetical protein